MVPESSIIMEYLENHHPGAGIRLIPEDPHDARRVRFAGRVMIAQT